ncbi:MAG: uroporphyrinogen decarboxylase family protein [Eubacterium sp.]|nr:uroporphyrinogen decarboxylase family protein [Eubacterium sp.]
MKINMYDWVDSLIAAEKKPPFPVLTFPAIQKLGITINDLVRSSDNQLKMMRIIAEETPMPAVAGMMDLSVEAEAFGSTVRFSDNEVPTVIGHIMEEEEDADALEIPEIGAGRTQIYIDAIGKAVEAFPDKPVFAGCIGPYSLAGRLLDVNEVMVLSLEEPDMVHTVLEKVSTFLISYMKAYKAVGANGVLMAEPLAGLLGSGMAQEFSSDYVKKIIDAVQDENFLVIYHNCGNTAIRTVDTIISNGARIFHFGNAIDMAEMMAHIPENCIGMGNLDPAGEFRNGTPESIREKTGKLMEACGGFRNFIPSSGCDIPLDASWENISAFFSAVENHYS